jgi:hypothetical protein
MLLELIWIAMSVAALLSPLLPWSAAVGRYGKLSGQTVQSPFCSYSSTLF